MSEGGREEGREMEEAGLIIPEPVEGPDPTTERAHKPEVVAVSRNLLQREVSECITVADRETLQLRAAITQGLDTSVCDMLGEERRGGRAQEREGGRKRWYEGGERGRREADEGRDMRWKVKELTYFAAFDIQCQ